MNDTTPQKPGVFRRVLFFLKLLEIRLRFVFVLVVTALVVGYWDYIQNYYERWQRARHPERYAELGGEGKKEGESPFEYFCPMHQFVVRDHPGSCPICGMALSQRRKGAAVELPAGTIMRVQVSPERIMQAGVQIEPVQYRLLTRVVRSYGAVEPAETGRAAIIARFPGRIEELMVNSVGMEVKKDQPLVRIYSPKFLAASREFLQVLASERDIEKDPQATAADKRRAAEIAGYARERLEFAGFTRDQLDSLAKTGKGTEYVTLNSPLAGTVLERNVVLGDLVDEGTVLYSIADLSTLWVQVQIIESEIAAVKAGMPVEVTTVAYPNKIFYGNLDFIYPTVNPELRAVKVRVVVANKEKELRPGMYVTAVIRSPIGRMEDVAEAPEPKAEPKKAPAKAPVTREVYWCPMHPEVVQDKPGVCDKCGGMQLIKKTVTEEAEPPNALASATERWAVGYSCEMHPDELSLKPGICTICDCGMKLKRVRLERVLAIPETSVIDTGTRYIVYVQSMPGVYDAHEVKLGPRAGAHYPVISGLNAGDVIVAQGSFLIDAEARLNPSTAQGAAAPAAEPAKEPAPPPKEHAAPSQPAEHRH